MSLSIISRPSLTNALIPPIIRKSIMPVMYPSATPKLLRSGWCKLRRCPCYPGSLKDSQTIYGMRSSKFSWNLFRAQYRIFSNDAINSAVENNTIKTPEPPIRLWQRKGTSISECPLGEQQKGSKGPHRSTPHQLATHRAENDDSVVTEGFDITYGINVYQDLRQSWLYAKKDQKIA